MAIYLTSAKSSSLKTLQVRDGLILPQILHTIASLSHSTLPGLIHTIIARKEVILSAGPINTPQLLLLSGVGSSEQLSSYGIKTIVESPGVGKNLQDHPLLSNQWFVNSNDTLDNIARNATLANELLVQWVETRTGQFIDTGGNQFAWLRIPSNSSIFSDVEDPAAGPTSAHMELFMGVSAARF